MKCRPEAEYTNAGGGPGINRGIGVGRRYRPAGLIDNVAGVVDAVVVTDAIDRSGVVGTAGVIVERAWRRRRPRVSRLSRRNDQRQRRTRRQQRLVQNTLPHGSLP